ncbi:MAG TPA: SpoIIE family protein phosphatase [Spirochaetota bacterium]|nr:SpoIIE family protein phosphatase [Spirochaetota bacterium]
MKFNLRTKLFIGFMALNLTVSFLLGYMLYRTSSHMFFENFRAHKLSLARAISTALDPAEHSGFTSARSMNTTAYARSIRLVSTIAKKESDIRYIYTLNLNPADGKLYYALDGNIPPQDIIWFETPSLAFDWFIGKEGALTVEYNYSFFTNDFTVDTDAGKIAIRMVNDPAKKQVLIQGTPMFTVRTADPLSADTPLGVCSKDTVVRTGDITINGKSLKCTFTYAPKNTPSSEPGQDFVESDDIIRKTLGYIREGKDHIDDKVQRGAFGSYITAYSTILDGNGRGTGIVCVDINAKEVDAFRRNILAVGIAVFFFTLILSTVLTIILSKHFTRPLARLMNGVNAIVRGDMNSRVEVMGGDEFTRLAESFNNMVDTIQASTSERERLIEEISRLNEGLERRVAERTMTVNAQTAELNRQMMMARRIQLSLLPATLPDIDAVSLSFKYQPVMAVGGDFIDFFCDGRSLTVFICDVSGHGVAAAFLAAMVKMSLPECYSAGSDTAEAVKRLYRMLSGKMGGHFISAIFCHIDLASGDMISTNAGHPAAFVVRGDGSMEYLGHRGTVICEDFPLTHTNITTRLEKGDKIVLYTDGIIEARDRNYEMYGEKALEDLVKCNSRLDVTGLCDAIYTAAVSHVGSQSPEFEDDMTVMVLEYRG